jgi:hypothetical protein
VLLDIVIDEINKEIEFYVINKCVMGVEILVGQNFTELPDVNYSKSGNLLKFSQLSTLNVNSIAEAVVNVGIDNDKVVKALIGLLNEYSDCRASNISQIGVNPTVQMTIQLTNAEPISRRARQYSDCERAQIRDLVEELLQNNIIRESNSPYASSVLLVKKKTGEYRLCIDYGPLNKITVKDKYPLPLIEEQLRRLSGFRYFTTLDLFSGYYHIPMAKSVPLTAFITQDGHYEFLRMPFGLTNAPAVFMRMVNSVLGQLRFTKVLCYLIDILIPARSVDETMSILRRVLEIFRANGLTLKLSKCSFLQTSIEYLGCEISGSEIRPTSHKIKAVRDFSVPTDVHRVRQFLGLTGYFRKFINDYAAVSRPLTSLLQKEAPWVWSQAQNTSFEALKTHLISDLVLTLFNPDLEIRLYTDTSCLGVAGILIQVNSKKENVISYFSKHTTANERKFHSFELKALAIVSSVRRFRQYLLGRSFTIVTDCAAVRNAFSKGEVNADGFSN